MHLVPNLEPQERTGPYATGRLISYHQVHEPCGDLYCTYAECNASRERAVWRRVRLVAALLFALVAIVWVVS